MALAPIPNKIWDGMRQAIAIFGESAIVKPRGAAQVNVLMAVGERRPDELIDGITQAKKVARVMAPDWDTAVGRAPEKGDVITVSGLRFAVIEVAPMMIGGAIRMYVIGIKGG